MKYVFASLLCLLALPLSAQKTIVESLQSNTGKGVVTIHSDSRITSLIGQRYDRSTATEAQRVLKARGYRVQVYAGNNSRVARDQAAETAEKVKKEFPEMSVYTFFQPPRWLCRVGDYRSIEEADVAMRKLRATGAFKEVAIVREQINIPIEQ